MSPSPALFLLFAATFPLPGAALALRGRAQGRDAADLAAEALVASAALTSLFALGAALVGVFHLGLVAALNVAAALAATLAGRVAAPADSRRGAAARPGAALAALLLLLACAALYFRPSEYVAGGWDPGVYASTGSSIARSGAITIRDRTLPALTAAERELFTYGERMPAKYPGFIIRDAGRGVIQPYFYHLFPALVALLDSGFGPRGGLFAAPLLVLLSLLPLFVLGRRLFGPAAASLAVVLFALSIPVVWQARLSTSEPAALLFFLGGWAMLADFERDGRRRSAVLAALAFLCALLAKITSIVPFLLLLAARRAGRGAAGERGTDLPGWLLAAALVPAAAWYLGPSRESTLFVFGFSGRAYGAWALGALVAVYLAGLAAAPRIGALVARRERVARFAAAGALAGLFRCAWVLRPLGGRSTDAGNLAELGWFVTPLFLAAALAGMVAALVRPADAARGRLQLLFLAVGAGTAAVLLHRKQVDPFYLWALRRYVPELLPVFALFAGHALALIAGEGGARRWRRAAAVGLCALIAIWGLARGRHLLAHREQAGSCDGIARVAALLPADALAVCSGRGLATPLQYLFGRETLQVSDDSPERWRAVAAALSAWAAGGRKVYLVMDGQAPPAGLGLEPAGEVKYAVPSLERSTRSYPVEIRDVGHDVRVYRVTPPVPSAGDASRAPASRDGFRIRKTSSGVMTRRQTLSRQGDFRWFAAETQGEQARPE